jgi:hypothetical protein
MLDALRARPDIGIVGPRLEHPDGEPQISCFRAPSPMATTSTSMIPTIVGVPGGPAGAYSTHPRQALFTLSDRAIPSWPSLQPDVADRATTTHLAHDISRSPTESPASGWPTWRGPPDEPSASCGKSSEPSLRTPVRANGEIYGPTPCDRERAGAFLN